MSRLKKEFQDAHVPKKTLSETTIVYDGAKGKVVVPHTLKACQYWGQNTGWMITSQYHDFFSSLNNGNPVIMLIPRESNRAAFYLTGKTIFYKYHEGHAAGDYSPKELSKAEINFIETFANHLSPTAQETISNFLPNLTKYKETKIENNTSTTIKAHKEKPIPSKWKPYIEQLKELERNAYGRKARRKIIIKDEKILDLLDNKEFVLEYLKHSYCITFASDRLKDDMDLLLRSMKVSASNFYEASNRLRKDKQFVIGTMKIWLGSLADAPKEIKQDKKFIKKLMIHFPDLPFCTGWMKENEVYIPNKKELSQYKFQALQKLLKENGILHFIHHARKFKSIWGDPEIIFGGKPEEALHKIAVELGVKYTTPSKAKKLKP